MSRRKERKLKRNVSQKHKLMISLVNDLHDYQFRKELENVLFNKASRERRAVGLYHLRKFINLNS